MHSSVEKGFILCATIFHYPVAAHDYCHYVLEKWLEIQNASLSQNLSTVTFFKATKQRAVE